jgi:hypothetical protein
MKTNQLMNIAFSTGEVEVFHKTSMGNLSQLWSAGNVSRHAEGKSPANLSTFLSSNKTQEFMREVERNIDSKCFEVNGRGRNRKTWANIHVMVYAAEYLSVGFHFEVIDTFINNKVLTLRDESGDQFKALNHCIDLYLPERDGKNNKGVFIQAAKLIKNRISEDLLSWNDATADQLRERLRIENGISEALRLGFIVNYDHMKTIIGKI